MSEEKIEIQKGSGNIFKDLEIPKSEEYLEKVHLAFIIEDRITESGLRVEEAARILNLSATKLSNLLDGLLDDFSIGDLTVLITKLKSVTADTVPGPIDRFFQWFREVVHSFFPPPLALGTAGFGVLVLIIGCIYVGNHLFTNNLPGGLGVPEGQLSKLTPISPTKVEPTLVREQGRDVRVSPFGFGAFPKLPADFPDQNIWNVVEQRSIYDSKGAKTLELLARVRIKLWEQGKHTKGVIMDPVTKLIYPDSGIKIILSANADDVKKFQYSGSADSNASRPKYDIYFDDGLIPQGQISVKFLKDGINPYVFLNLQ